MAEETWITRERGPIRPPARVFAPGDPIGSYRLLEPLGSGASGDVWVAEHAKLGRRVALKMLREDLGSNERSVARFFGEARAVNDIAHDNIVAITDFVDATSDQPTFYIMELLEGETLEARIARQGRLPIADVVHIGKQLASALAATHDHGIIHRDLKPANVFLTVRDGDDRWVKLLDYGVAKLEGPGDGVKKLDTAVGSLVGTPTYMSPEQTYGLAVDLRADIYALGLLLFEMIVGKAPFGAQTIERVFEQHQIEPAPRPSRVSGRTLPSGLEALVLQCLAKKRAARPASASSVAERLGRIALPKPSLPPRIERQRASRSALAVGLLGLASAIVVAAVWSSRPAPAPTPIAAMNEPASASQVWLTFVTDPSGAAVQIDGHEQALGYTPLSTAVARSDVAIGFQLELPGYRTERQRLVPSRDIEVRVAMQVVLPPPVPTPPTRPSIRAKPARAKSARPSPTKRRQVRRQNRREPRPPVPRAEPTAPRIEPSETRNPFE